MKSGTASKEAMAAASAPTSKALKSNSTPPRCSPIQRMRSHSPQAATSRPRPSASPSSDSRSRCSAKTPRRRERWASSFRQDRVRRQGQCEVPLQLDLHERGRRREATGRGAVKRPAKAGWRNIHARDQSASKRNVALGARFAAVPSSALGLRHRFQRPLAADPSDKLLPSFAEMGETIYAYAFEPDPRTGVYLLWADTAGEF